MVTKGKHFIDGQWVAGEGDFFTSKDPATGANVWEGHRATDGQVRRAVEAAHRAFDGWGDMDVSERVPYLTAFRDQLGEQREQVARAICLETGKPHWEALTEVDAMTAKVGISIDAYQQRCCAVIEDAPGSATAVRYKPHGVVAVLGPFNFPGHLPNGQIVPALLAGNSVVFKPSRQTPLVGELMTEIWEAAGIPPGVINLVQAGRQMGSALARQPEVSGVFFTGSAETGRAIHTIFAGKPNVILALEMGGNSPLVVHEVSEVSAAAYMTVLSAYITSGQRCSCARRLIVTAGQDGERFIDALIAMIGKIRVGLHTDEPEPFMGPVISTQTARELLEAQSRMEQHGGHIICRMGPRRSIPTLLSPGLIDVTGVPDRPDQELFGPLLQLIRVPDFDAALQEANNTSYGLTAGLLCHDRGLFEKFHGRIRAGVVHWNRPTTGASSRLPFGGVGASGNHRPGAYFTADFCSHPVASIEEERILPPDKPLPGIDI